MTDRRDEERERTQREWEDDVHRQNVHRQKESERRSEELREAWRRNHPSEREEGGKRQPKRDRPV